MFGTVGITTKGRKHTASYFYCPNCRSRKPCHQGSWTRYFTFFFIPLIPFGTAGEYYECDGCSMRFDVDSNFLFDFGDHPAPKLWTCERCGSANPSHAYDCEVCGQ